MGIVSNYILVDDLKIGMVLGQDITDEMGNTLLAKGMELRNTYIGQIEKLNFKQVLISTISKVDFPNETEIEEIHNIGHSDLERLTIISEETRQDAKKVINACMEKVLEDSPIGVEKIVLIVNQIIDEILKSEEVTFNLAELRLVDDYTFEHSVNVGVLSIITGISVGLNKVELVELGMGAILHDIGKMLIPKEILNKPGILTDEEFNIIKKHTVRGFEVLSKIKDVSLKAANVALYHHERYDGKGYPEMLESKDTHIYSKIVAIADVFDALTSDRVYSKKISPYKAMEYIISMSEAHFDRVVIAKFAKFVGYYYRGQMVKLNTGEVALISKKHQSKPVVRVVLDNCGKKVNNYYEIDLAKNPSVLVNSIIYQDKAIMDRIIDNSTS